MVTAPVPSGCRTHPHKNVLPMSLSLSSSGSYGSDKHQVKQLYAANTTQRKNSTSDKVGSKSCGGRSLPKAFGETRESFGVSVHLEEMVGRELLVLTDNHVTGPSSQVTDFDPNPVSREAHRCQSRNTLPSVTLCVGSFVRLGQRALDQATLHFWNPWLSITLGGQRASRSAVIGGVTPQDPEVPLEQQKLRTSESGTSRSQANEVSHLVIRYTELVVGHPHRKEVTDRTCF